MNALVFAALLPVVLVVGLGFWVGRLALVSPEGIRDLSRLTFLVLTPAFLFRTMGTVHPEQLDFVPVLGYFAGVMLLFMGVLLVHGLRPRSVVLALTCTFSNTTMIGIPLISLAYGQAGLVVLLTLVSVHALVLLTTGTLMLELAAQGRSSLRSLLRAVRDAVVHPIPLPILLGLAFAQTGMALPAVLDKPLQWIGGAFSPMALLLVGMTLAQRPARAHWNTAVGLVIAKNLLLPLLVAVAAWLLDVDALHRTVIVVAASLPVGANVLLFSQRYQAGEAEVTAAVALSTLLALATVSLTMYLLPY